MSSNLEKALGFNLEAFNYLYVLCDYETLLKKNITLENFLEILKKYDVKLLQYRDKVSDLELQKQNLIFLKQNLNIPIIVNDKVELIDYADGLHVGQDDVLKIDKDKKLAIKLLRKIPGKAHPVSNISTSIHAFIFSIGLMMLNFQGILTWLKSLIKLLKTD